jgi:thiamine biosynthesis lipoprotein
MLKKGIQAGIVNGSGDMNTWGTQPNGEPWNVGITNPMKEDTIFAIISLLKQSAVVTSGSYQKYVVFKGKRYSHIINPATVIQRQDFAASPF